MKAIKFILMLLACFTLTATLSAQSAKLEKRASKQIEKLNEKIMSEDASLALSAEQKMKLLPIYVAKIEKIDAIKSGDDAADAQQAQIKEARKNCAMESREVLSKAQLKAKRAAYQSDN